MRLMKSPFLFSTLSMLAVSLMAQQAPEPPLEFPALTLPQARAEALNSNPELKAAEAGWRASQGGTRQARTLLNPGLEVSRDDFGGSLPMDQRAPQEALALTQTVRLSGKRQAEIAAADSASAAAVERYRQVRLDVLTGVERQFAELLGAQERERIATENLDTAQEMARVVQALVEAGEASPIEAVRAQNEQDLAAIDYQGALQDLATAKSTLARTLGMSSVHFERAEGTLAEEVAVPDEEAVLLTLQRLPDLARLSAETRRLEASLQRARREAIPDPTFSVGMKRYTTTQEKAYFAGVAIPIPLFNRNRGGIIEASARLDQGQLEMRAEEIRLRALVATTRSSLRRSADEVASLRERVLPKAEQVYSAVNEGYLRGKFRLLDLLEARRSLASLRLRFVDAVVRLNLAKADMDRLSVNDPTLTEGATP